MLCGLALHLPTIREVSGDQSIQEKLDEHLGAIKHQFERQARQHHHYVEVGVDNFGSVPCSEPTDNDSVFNYSIPYLNESLGQINFNDYRGKVILLVNVATFCESTIEYPMYNDLIRKYGDKIQLVGFPCNQFWNVSDTKSRCNFSQFFYLEQQEPSSSAEEIYNAIKYVRPGNGFEPLFPLTKRIDVNGENQHAIYSFLKVTIKQSLYGKLKIGIFL